MRKIRDPPQVFSDYFALSKIRNLTHKTLQFSIHSRVLLRFSFYSMICNGFDTPLLGYIAPPCKSIYLKNSNPEENPQKTLKK